jgi:rhodanese-related sulfurtransferase
LSDVPEIDVDALEGHIGAGALVIDVRESDEYTGGHVAGARHVPLTTVPDQLHAFPDEQPFFVICAVGARSGRAVQFLRAQGFDATNVAGGTRAWLESGRPVVAGPDPI